MSEELSTRTPTYPKVALLVETSRGFGRQLLSGVARYAHLHGPWSFYITPGDFAQVVPRIREWNGDGIIARVANQRVEDAIIEADIPTIVLGLRDRPVPPDSPLKRASRIRGNSNRASELAAEHLLEKHFRHYAYVGISDRGYSLDRQLGFCERIEAAGYGVFVYETAKRLSDRKWEVDGPRLTEWIKQLPKPIGVMACNDDRGREVLDACRRADVAVPEDVSVVGVDNDDLFCDLADPPMSSVAFNAELGGYQAAELLDRLMAGKVTKPQTVMIEPLHVVTRRSSDVIALDDREVASALAYIHQEKGRGMTVDDVADQLAVSRRYIEVRFRQALGRTILAEITRVRLENARRLLEMTNYSIPKIADLAGYNSASYLITVFRQNVGMTPAQYRKSLRA